MFKKKCSRVFISLLTILFFTLSSTVVSFGCTAIYFGKDVTDNGTTLVGRSEDSSWKNYKKNYTVRKAATHASGAMYTGSGGFTVPYPAKTFRYTLVKDYTGEGEEEMAQVGTNEKGVAVTGTVSLSGGKPEIVGARNSEVTPVDAMVSDGLREEDIPSVVLMQAESARHGAEILIDIYETIGAGGRDMTMITDKNETWIVQSLSGHNAVAVKAPADVVGLSPNITANVDLSNKKDTIMTKNLVKTPEQAGTLKRDAQGGILIADSYAIEPQSVSNRLWQGYYYLKGESFANKTEAGYIDFFKTPRKEKNYTLYEALRLLAFRGEGTEKYGGTGTGNSAGIGCDNNLEAHVFEVRHDMPAELSVIQWLALSPPEFGVYIPGYNALVTETIAENGIGLDTMVYNNENPSANSYRTVFYELYFLCKGRDRVDEQEVGSLQARTKYGSGVQQFWEKYQKSLISQQKEIDKDMQKILAYDYDLALKKATELNKHLQTEALGYAKEMVAELKAWKDDGGVYTPTALKEGKLPTYSFDAIGGTGLPKDVKDAAVSKISNQTYTGKAKKPALTVKYDGKTLAKDKDYTVTYSENKKVGTAKATIKGINGFVGTKTVTFQIVPKKTSIKTVKAGYKKATVSWKKVAGTTKYQVRYKTASSKTWKIKNVSAKSTKATIKKLKKGKKYNFQVRSYKTVKKVKYRSAWSKTKSVKIK